MAICFITVCPARAREEVSLVDRKPDFYLGFCILILAHFGHFHLR
jgi:hypothetical protein